MKALDALRGDATDPRAPGRLTNILSAIAGATAVSLWIAYLVFGFGGRLLP